MTPANPDALEDALAESMLRHEWPNADLIPFAEQDARIREYWIGQARAQIAGPLAPLLADLQRVTAERDEYAEALMKVAEIGGWQASSGLAAEVQSRITTAEARAAQLQAEVEAKDRERGSDARAVIELCDSVLGNAYIGKGREDALAGRAKAAFMKTALAARAATAREG